MGIVLDLLAGGLELFLKLAVDLLGDLKDRVVRWRRARAATTDERSTGG